MATPDITVRGAGVFGLSIAWACASRGARVQVIDPRGPGGGASGGVLGALAPHTPERWNAKKQFQLESLLMASDFWREVDGCSGLSSGYGRIGRLMLLANENAVRLARQRERAAQELWRGAAQWHVVEAKPDSAWHPASPTGLLVHDTLSARINPHRACLSLAAALRKRGVSIVSDGPEKGVVVHATGHEGLLALSHELGRPVGTGIKGQAAVLAFDAGDAPQIFAEGLHIVPHENATVAIGSTTEREFDAPDTTDHQLDALISRAVDLMPALAGARILATWAGVRPRARSRAPLLDAWPGRPGHYIANGGFKIGFGMAPGVARVMADLLVDGVDTIPEDFRLATCLR